MTPITSEQKHFLLIHQALVPGAFNAVINGFFVWLLFRNRDIVSVGGDIIPDATITLFLIYALTCAIVTPLVARMVPQRTDLRTKARRADYPPLKLLPDTARGATLAARSAIFGLVGVVFWIPLMWLSFAILDIQDIFASDFIILKIIYTGVAAALITPVIAWCAICDANEKLGD